MNFKQALNLLEKGGKIKLPEWDRFWFADSGIIRVFTSDNKVLNTPHILTHKDREDWQEAVVIWRKTAEYNKWLQVQNQDNNSNSMDIELLKCVTPSNKNL